MESTGRSPACSHEIAAEENSEKLREDNLKTLQPMGKKMCVHDTEFKFSQNLSFNLSLFDIQAQQIVL